jgi:diguanylate cyclase (GGDEF)-like protein
MDMVSMNDEASSVFHAALCETLPRSERDWVFRMQFSPTIEQSFLKYYAQRTARWILVASLLFGGLMMVRVAFLLVMQHQHILQLLVIGMVMGVINLPIIAKSINQLSMPVAPNRSPHLVPIMVVFLPMVCGVFGQIFIVGQYPDLLGSIVMSLLQAIILVVLVLRMRMLQSILLMLAIDLLMITLSFILIGSIEPLLVMQVITITTIGIFVSFLLEYDARRDFLSHAQIYRLATTDQLSLALNRYAFYYCGEIEFDRARRYGRSLSLLLIDIDHFKQINDQHGHRIGDEIIAAFGMICRDHIRSTDLLGRVGGEEFAILMPETDRHAATQVGERLCRLLAHGIPNSALPRFTVSIGIASMHHLDANFHQLFERSDGYLYIAKRSGRNQVVVEPSLFESPLHARAIGQTSP